MARKQKDQESEYKYVRVKTDISLQILEGQLRPHDPIPSLNEIVQKYKVSKITARRVLSDLVSEGLVYASRGRGSFVTEHALKSPVPGAAAATHPQLGVVFEHGAGSFMNDIIMGIDEEAHDRGVQINLCLSQNSYSREAENLERLVKQGVDRVLLFMVVKHDSKAMNENIPLYLRLLEQGVQILLLARNLPNVKIPSLTWEDYAAYQKLVSKMAAGGKKNLVFISRDDNASTTQERERGYKDGLLENGLPFRKSWLLKTPIRSYDTVMSDASQYFRDFLSKNEKPDGIVCSDELIAAGVFATLEQLNIPMKKWPWVGGMGSRRNLHMLKDHPYILLEDDTHSLGRKAAALMLDNELEHSAELIRMLPVPMRFPRTLG